MLHNIKHHLISSIKCPQGAALPEVNVEKERKALEKVRAREIKAQLKVQAKRIAACSAAANESTIGMDWPAALADTPVVDWLPGHLVQTST